MATVRREFDIPAPPTTVWDAIADFHAVHERLAPGFVADCRTVEGDRLVTFSTGAVVRERLVTSDADQRRLVYTVIESELDSTHHQAIFEVDPAPGRAAHSRVVWITDVLPHDNARVIEHMMDAGIAAIIRTLSSDAA